MPLPPTQLPELCHETNNVVTVLHAASLISLAVRSTSPIGRVRTSGHPVPFECYRLGTNHLDRQFE